MAHGIILWSMGNGDKQTAYSEVKKCNSVMYLTKYFIRKSMLKQKIDL